MDKSILLDANAVLRYLLDDVHDQHQTVKEAIESKNCVCILSTIQEVVYVLENYYHVPRKAIANALLPLKDLTEIEDEDVFVSALRYYLETPKIDFADCIMCGYRTNRDIDILTFDKKLEKKLNSLKLHV
ncbi:MAG: PIN domain-containing protein [Erysipelotrichaceae bacterium]|nr:PIN domain-containing protein [Erysipelotrichaceae bacterium]